MRKIKGKQMIAGKSFEYALLNQFEEKMRGKTQVEVIINSSYEIAKGCFDKVTSLEQSEYMISASFAVNFLMDVEPRLVNDVNKNDILQLEILSDEQGKKGDVRDVLIIRLLQKWEIGVSAKNNHRAVKHSRLSTKLDFGKEWLGMPVSQEYFKSVIPIFEGLKNLRVESKATKLWKDLDNKEGDVYIPILEAFSRELLSLHDENPLEVSKRLIAYLVGRKDFYKVIKGKNKVEIHAYNINNTLNLPFKSIQPTYKTPVVSLPTKIEDIVFKEKSKTTLIVTLDNNWTLSFRIHNASSRIEPSLKFDINLIKSPKSLYRTTLNIINSH